MAVFSFELDIQDEVALSAPLLIPMHLGDEAHRIAPFSAISKRMTMMIVVGGHGKCDSYTSGNKDVAPGSEFHDELLIH
ncbi:hypothetical protein C7E13_00450 [Stenotrophomonas maltophilia]|nr:hypothetical protein [Stenotrophomonas maltophilia]MBA0365163.1 hypothetical protein [Stenotrophomonas maltophilia]MBA0403476.1 hypothetical protein [Stenotrophomonas maltophilia]PSD25245.1 hypothetical protein C7E13_00450 [Stenotrophomonas maltophilia]PZT22165.1 hypothetical protein A7X86_05080 [Stenotrophomonas maltophilia]